MTLVNDAREFARQKHNGQKRKYTDEDYFVHCESVANLVALITGNEAAVAAAYLHDVMEDCGVDYTTLVQQFGEKVADLVNEVTDVSLPGDGNRRTRVTKNIAHLSGASPLGMTIKLADIFDNCLNIVELDPGYARKYLAEKANAIEVLEGGDAFLYNAVRDFVRLQRMKLDE